MNYFLFIPMKTQSDDQPLKWIERISSEFDTNKGFETKSQVNYNLMKGIFGEMKLRKESPMYCKDYDVKFKDTACIVRILGPKLGGGWKLLLNTKINTVPKWRQAIRKESNASFKRRNEEDKKEDNQGNDINTFEQIQEEMEEEDSERDKLRKSNIDLFINRDWLSNSQSQKVEDALPNKDIPRIEILDNYTNEEIFQVANNWVKHINSINEELKKSMETFAKFNNPNQVKSGDVLGWMKLGNRIFLEQNKTINMILNLVSLIAKKMEGLKKLEERNTKKINQEVKVPKIGKAFQSGKFFRSAAIAKRNIEKYKKNKTWIEEKDWKKMTFFQRIMKRWRFTDTHQCLTPWDEGKLNEQEMIEFHQAKQKWRSERKQDIINSGKQNSWIMRRFEKFCHSRIIGNRVWSGLDIKYDDFIGVNKEFDKISWKIYKRRNIWRPWKPRNNNTKNNEKGNVNVNNINNVNMETDEEKYWGKGQEWGKNEN